MINNWCITTNSVGKLEKRIEILYYVLCIGLERFLERLGLGPQSLFYVPASAEEWRQTVPTYIQKLYNCNQQKALNEDT